MSTRTKQINELKTIVGYYSKKESDTRGKVIDTRFFKLSYDESSDMIYIQRGYLKKDGSINENKPISLKSVGPALTHQKDWIKEGFEKNNNEPKGLLTLEQIKNGQLTNSSEEISFEEVKEETPKLVAEEGKTVLIANQLLNIRQGQFEHVPSKNDNYFFDTHAEDVILDIQENRRVLLVGHTGCGKTSLLTEIASRINQSVIRSNMNGQTTVSEFVGMWTVKGGETIWVDGVLPKAMKEGMWLIIDEIDCADASILAILNSVLEKNGTLTLKEKGHEVIKPHDNFRIFATANAVGAMASFRHLYQGTNLMNEAFLDRFRVYLVNYMNPSEEVKVLTSSVSGLKKEWAEKMVRVANMVRESFTKGEIESTFSTRRLIDWGEMALRRKDLRRAAQIIIFSKVNGQDAKVIEGILNRI